MDHKLLIDICLYEHQKGASLNLILVLGQARNGAKAGELPLFHHNITILQGGG